MKKITTNRLLASLILLGMLNTASAKAVLNIIPASKIANLNLTGLAILNYTVTNDTKHTINQLTVDPAYLSTGNPAEMILVGDQCTAASLAPNAKCTFQILFLGATTQPVVFEIRPRVCGYNGAVCSVPLAENAAHIRSIPHISFVTNFGNNTLSNCTINPDGTFGTCMELMDPSFNGPAGVTFNAVGTFIDVANFNDNSVSICPLTANGMLGACTRFADPTFNGPVSIKSDIEINNIYITNYNNNTVSICPITSPGVLGSCSVSNQTFFAPNTIALNSKGTFAYVTNHANDTVAACPINPDGTLGTCNASNPGATFHGPTGIVINALGTFAYISNSNNVGGNRNVSICPINSNGSLGTCSAYISTLFNFDNFGKIAINAAATNLYVVNQINNYVTLCALNPDGYIDSCSRIPQNETFNSPQGITVG